MRAVAFIQVLLLLLLLLYSLLVALENPQLLHLPLPFGWGEWLLPAGSALCIFAGLGAAYMLLLMLPPLLQSVLKHRQTKRLLKELERRFTQTLQAKISSNERQMNNLVASSSSADALKQNDVPQQSHTPPQPTNTTDTAHNTDDKTDNSTTTKHCAP